MQVQDLPPLVHTVAEAAKYRLKMAKSTVYEHINAGTLEATRIGGRTYITERACKEFVERHEKATRQAHCSPLSAVLNDMQSKAA
ncbi:helix-turn-helix domain-containing protein [Lysobacter enzymogenes]|uniref:helix-turn-helix domain-containing protein n=1 Tax=Lysobacter enzymogenes TaxID=69 RepID=UPI001A95D5B0|nr:helix-turn-helix domain-containing protein [Lysobacter enzymogenes]QQP97943.1 helix-turn-helix domain-containing protein [Lysobacter enzymogenes]